MWHPLIHGGLPYNKLFIFKRTELEINNLKVQKLLPWKLDHLNPTLKFILLRYEEAKFYMDTCTGTLDQIY